MTIFMRRIIQLALGILAGLAAWPAMELLIHLQPRFSSYLIYAAVSGALFGLIFGALLGGAEGIIASRTRRVVTGTVAGALIGLVGGAIGFLGGQEVLFFVGDRIAGTIQQVDRVALPLGRSIGWALLGAFVGAAGGIRVLSGRKSLIGTLGGFVGGLVGGAVVEYGQLLLRGAPAARLAGLLLLGILIGLAYAWVEKRLSFGTFRVLNGPFKSREFILNQRRMTIGSRAACDIPVPGVEASRRGAERRVRGYRDVAPLHCRLVARGRELYIQPLDGRIRLNEEVVDANGRLASNPLKFDDVIACGEAKFLYMRG